MKKLLTSIVGLSAVVPALAFSTAGSAAVVSYVPAAMSMNPMASAAFGAQGCNDSALPSTFAPSPATPTMRFVSKSSAVLEGEMSALDRIRAQQNGTAIAGAQRLADSGQKRELQPAASPNRLSSGFCSLVQSPTPQFTRSAAFARNVTGDFLGSRRVQIMTTSFDRDWQRVGYESVSGMVPGFFAAEVSPSMATVEAVNRWVNREIRYVEDRALFGHSDYWAGARLTMALRRGDCEDIALTKMQILASAGFSRDDMFLTIARDTVRRADHALLVVRMGDKFLVLDNATDVILDGAYSHDYAPVLSFAQTGKWLHGA